MEIAVAIVIVVVIAIGAGIVLGRRRRPSAPVPPARPARPEPEPMTGLEEALASVTDRSGTSMRDRLDAESAHVDPLRVNDDTGPLLRRALDHVAPGDGGGQATPGAEQPTDLEPDDEPGAERPSGDDDVAPPPLT